MVMSGSSMATYLMISLILLISAFIIVITVSDQQQQLLQQQQETRTIVIPGSSSTFNIFKKEASPSSSDSEQQFEKIIESLMATQDYSNWADVHTATFLIPTDDNPFSSSCQSLSSTIGYHIIPQQLSFSVLRTFPIGSRIPTLLPEKSILVTNNSKSNYTIDEIQITYPDLYVNGAVVVHGINSTLNYTVYGCKDSGKRRRSLLDYDPFSIIEYDDINETQEVTVSSSSSGSTQWVIVLIVVICCIVLVLGWILFRSCCFKQQGEEAGNNQEEEMQPLNEVNQGNLNVGNEQVQEHVNVQNLGAEEVVNEEEEVVYEEAAAVVGVADHIIEFPEEGEDGNPILNDQFGGAAEVQEDEHGNLLVVINQVGVAEEEGHVESPVSIEQESGPENSSITSSE